MGEIDQRCISATTNCRSSLPSRPLRTPGFPTPKPGRRSRSTRSRAPRRSSSAAYAERSAHAFPSGEVSFHTSKDPVGAPIFYRDVPLMPSETEKGVIKPLAANAIHLIQWRLRSIDQPQSRVVLEGHAHLRQLPFLLPRWQDDGHGHGWSAERQGPVCPGSVEAADHDPQPGHGSLEPTHRTGNSRSTGSDSCRRFRPTADTC